MEEVNSQGKILRKLLPVKPYGWHSEEFVGEYLSERGHKNLKTYNYYTYHEACASFLLALRRCDFQESAFWALEMFRVYPTDVMRKLLIYSTTEIGPANLNLIKVIDKIISIDSPHTIFDECELLKCVETLAISYKDKTFAWLSAVTDEYLCEEPFLDEEGEEQMPKETVETMIMNNEPYSFEMLRSVLANLEQALANYNFDQAINLVHLIYKLQANNKQMGISKDEFNRLKKFFEFPSMVKNVKSIELTAWMPLLGLVYKPRNDSIGKKLTKDVAQCSCDLVCHLYHISTRGSKLKFKPSSLSRNLSTYNSDQFETMTGCNGEPSHSSLFQIEEQKASPTIQFLIHAIYVYCNPEEVGLNQIADNSSLFCHNFVGKNDDERTKIFLTMVSTHMNRLGLYGVPNVVDVWFNSITDYISKGCRLEKIVLGARDSQIHFFVKAIESMIRRGLINEAIRREIELDYLFPNN